MRERYIELDDICHLDGQAKGRGVFGNKNWRESYYFNMTDPRTGITLLTTIGMLPNKKRTAGFVLLMKDWKTLLLKPLVVFERPNVTEYRFKAKGLEYSIEGADWRLRYKSEELGFDIRFTPVNKIYPYVTEDADRAFETIGSQHYEQSGRFEGCLVQHGKRIGIGPCYGHRDHSWGIRDWSSVDRYRLFCCTFSDRFAFNLWKGRVGDKDFLKGYVFDGKRNARIIKSEVRTNYGNNGLEPKEAVVNIIDDTHREFEIKCKVASSHRIPPKGSLMYETIAKMEVDGKKGYGLLEYLYHCPNPLRRAPIFADIFKEMLGAS